MAGIAVDECAGAAGNDVTSAAAADDVMKSNGA